MVQNKLLKQIAVNEDCIQQAPGFQIKILFWLN